MTPWFVLIAVVALWWALIGRSERKRAAQAEVELEAAKTELERASARLGKALKDMRNT